MSGENPKIREAMDRMTRQLVDGGMASDKARKIAQNEAIKHDRKQQDKR